MLVQLFITHVLCHFQLSAQGVHHGHHSPMMLLMKRMPTVEALAMYNTLRAQYISLTDDVVHEADAHSGGVGHLRHLACDGHVHYALQSKHGLWSTEASEVV